MRGSVTRNWEGKERGICNVVNTRSWQKDGKDQRVAQQTFVQKPHVNQREREKRERVVASWLSGLEAAVVILCFASVESECSACLLHKFPFSEITISS